MGFLGLVIANNLGEIVGGLCVVIVIGWGGIKLGRWQERRKHNRATRDVAWMKKPE